jgi:hypothetical protein
MSRSVAPYRRQANLLMVREARRQRSLRLYRAKRARWAYRMKRIRRAFLTFLAIFAGAIGTSFFTGGLGDGAWLGVFFLAVIAFIVLSIYPSSPRTRAEDLDAADLPELAPCTELWLESRRRALPPPALDAVDMIGVRLEQLAPQLETLDPGQPAAREVRKLLSEHLPGLVDSYTRIPTGLRRKEHVGSTPERQLVEGLNLIADEIGTMSEQLAQGELDALAVRGRYLETKYISEGSE